MQFLHSTVPIAVQLAKTINPHKLKRQTCDQGIQILSVDDLRQNNASHQIRHNSVNFVCYKYQEYYHLS